MNKYKYNYRIPSISNKKEQIEYYKRIIKSYDGKFLKGGLIKLPTKYREKEPQDLCDALNTLLVTFDYNIIYSNLNQ